MSKCDKCPFKLLVESQFKEPTIAEIKAYALEIGFTNLDAEYFYWKHKSTGWVDKNGLPYREWRGVLQIWFRAALQRGDVKEKGKTFKERYNASS